MRGLILNSARLCPACGEETMRGDMPLLLTPVEAVLRARCSYRWCRRCRKTWLAIHPPRRTPVRKQPVPPHRRPSKPAQAPQIVEKSPDLSGSWRAESGALAWTLRLTQTAEGEVQGTGTLTGAGREFALTAFGSVRRNEVQMQLDCGGSLMPFTGCVAEGAGRLVGEVRLGDSSRPLAFQRHGAPWGPHAPAFTG